MAKHTQGHWVRLTLLPIMSLEYDQHTRVLTSFSYLSALISPDPRLLHANVVDYLKKRNNIPANREDILEATGADVSDPALLSLLKNNPFVRVEDGMGYDLFSYRVRCSRVHARLLALTLSRSRTTEQVSRSKSRGSLESHQGPSRWIDGQRGQGLVSTWYRIENRATRLVASARVLSRSNCMNHYHYHSGARPARTRCRATRHIAHQREPKVQELASCIPQS